MYFFWGLVDVYDISNTLNSTFVVKNISQITSNSNVKGSRFGEELLQWNQTHLLISSPRFSTKTKEMSGTLQFALIQEWCIMYAKPWGMTKFTSKKV